MSNQSLPPPGWYPDPGQANAGQAYGGAWPGASQQGQLRWWDGFRWTAYTTVPAPASLAPTSPVSGFPASAYPAPAPRLPSQMAGSPVGPFRSERNVGPWARLAIVLFAGNYAAQGILLLVFASQWHQWWTETWDAITNPPLYGQVHLPAQPYPLAYFSVITLAALAVWLLWQCQAATTARKVGMPSGCSVGWGIVGWFVPVANFWVPAQAMTGCLRPGHPLRQNVWKFWVAYIFNGLFTGSLFFTIPLARPVGVAFLIVSLGLTLLTAAGAWRLVTAVEEDHRVALQQAGWA